MAIDEINLRPPTFLHILPHRGTLFGGRTLSVSQPLLVASTHRRVVALARTCNCLRRQMQNLLQLITVRFSYSDCLASEPGREMTDRLALQHLSAGQTRAG